MCLLISDVRLLIFGGVLVNFGCVPVNFGGVPVNFGRVPVNFSKSMWAKKRRTSATSYVFFFKFKNTELTGTPLSSPQN